MSATRVPVRWVCCSCWIPLLVFSSPAHALDGAKHETAPIVGPQVSLSAEQLAAIQAKRDADPSVRRTPVADPRAVKPTGPPPAPSGRPVSDVPLVSAPPRQKTVAWPSISPSLGPIPRPSWTAPWLPKKPADVTISRPLPAATGAGATRGSR